MTNIILGTAGHIDHGKTALIKALTGVDLDQLKEEKERGITIELGFTSLSIPGDQMIGVVDVPGHEKFIKRMIAGAGGIDLVMLVVAADDGVMPQTREHLEICHLLDIKYGLIALTKIDLVEPDWVELIREDLLKLVKGTFLEGAPIVPVSALTGKGIPQLISTIEALVPKIKKTFSGGLAFLPIDRVFSMKGFGTVVTGTLISGEISIGETIEILPEGLQAKVRGIQAHNSQIETAHAGQRTAINLQGVERSFFKRGDILSHPGTLEPSFRFDVWLKILPDIPQPIKHGDEIRFHLFTTQTLARVISYEGNVLEPDGEYFAQVRFSEPMTTIPGARFVIRNIDASRTIGGGQVLDPHPQKHRRNDPATKDWFKILHANNLETILTTLALTYGLEGMTQKEVLRRISALPKEIEKVWKSLLQSKTLVEVNPETQHAFHKEILVNHEQRLKTLLQDFHKNHPLKPGLPLEEARQRLGRRVSEELFKYFINELKTKGDIEVSGVVIHQTSHKVSLKAEQVKLKNEIEGALRTHGLTPPTVREFAAQVSISPEEIKNLLGLLVTEEKLIKVKDDLYFLKEQIVELKQKLIFFLEKNKELTPGDFKEITGVTRKYAIPLLEYFDREKVTMRKGDVRLLRERKQAG
jgi:selenocysteine-specific elongation factor SelB